MKVVIDASVALKWFFRLRNDEPEVDAALALLNGVLEGHIDLIQPPHFIAEVGAVLARESPKTALGSLRNLLDVEMEIVDAEAVYAKAIEFSIRFKHHLFDTLYQAVALESTDAVLVTADEHYYRKAKAAGRIVRLADFSLAG